MLLKRCVSCVLLWIMFIQVKSNYVLSGVTFIWSAATKNERYAFASPSLNFGNDPVLNVGGILNESDEAWIGYFQMETAFEYFGCSLINDNAPTQTLSQSWNTPGFCFSLCNGMSKNVFGLNDKKCFCFDGNPSSNITEIGCDNNNNSNWVAGGGNKYMSLYRKKEIEEAASPTKGKCFAYSRPTQNRHTLWDSCSKGNKNICVNDGKVVPVEEDTGGQWHFPWTQYVKRCFEHGFTPVTYQDVQNKSLTIVNATSNSWTNLIRSEAIFNYKEYINDSKTKKYAYIKRKGTLITLHFTSDETLLKQGLFEGDDVIESTKSEMTTSTQKTTTKSGVSVAVGVSVSILAVILAVVILAIMFVKRRWGFQSQCFKRFTSESIKATTTASDLHSTENIVYETPQDVPYNEISDFSTGIKTLSGNDLNLEKGQYAHTYFILERHTLESDEHMVENKTIYNTLDSQTNFDRKINVNDTYDTMEKAAFKLQNKSREEKIRAVSDDEDTYNHVNSKDIKHSKTDNVYGITNEFESGYGYHKAKQEKDVGGDTYSHIN